MVDLGNRVLSGLSLSASLLVVTPGVVVPSVGDLNGTHEKGQKSKSEKLTMTSSHCPA